MNVIVFDLDDTLYDEMAFVRSGFRAVSRFLLEEAAIPAEESYEQMTAILQAHGRGKVFDDVLTHYRVHSKKRVAQCLRVYRTHRPDIHLYADAARCLGKLEGYPIYIVTDGNKHVQLSKLLALGLYNNPRIRKCYISRRFGIRNEKPSTHCFQHICRREKVNPQQIVYIGDNPNKDFVGIKPLGFRTVRLLRGSYADVQKPQEYEAELQLHSLDQFDASAFFTMELGGA